MQPPSLLVELTASCRDGGMNLMGAVDAVDFDRAQPMGRRVGERRRACGTILVLGTGGARAFEHVKAAEGGRLRDPHPRYHPIDDWSRAIADACADRIRARGHPCEVALPFERRALNFRQLAEAAGLGVVSPVIGHLLHPEFGPWVSLRAAILIDGRPFGTLRSAPLEFDPCSCCARPCVSACPIDVYRDARAPAIEACARHRLQGGCHSGCGSLHACPVGAAHRYVEEEERFRNRYSLFAIERWLGVGAWSLVPSRLRRRT